MKFRLFIILAGLAMASLIGCKTKCEQYCERHVACFPQEVENSIVGELIGLKCDWTEGPQEAEASCISACNREFDQLSFPVAEEVSRCMDCQLRGGGERGEGCNNYDEMFKGCDVECTDNEVEEFFEDFDQEAALVDAVLCD